MTPARVVGAWAAGNTALALLLLPFRPAPLPPFLYLAGSALVAGYGILVLRSARSGEGGGRRRQPTRAASAACVAIGIAVGLTAFVYGWWLAPLAFYPLLIGASLAPGERADPRARLQSGTPDLEPAEPPRAVHDGSPEGVAHAQRPGSSPLRAALALGVGARAALRAITRRGR